MKYLDNLFISNDIINKYLPNNISINDCKAITNIHYKRIAVPKKNSNRYRILHDPVPWLKIVQKEISSILSNIPLPDYIAGFSIGRSVEKNAKYHTNKKIVLSFDIKDFFDTISSDMVSAALSKYIKSNNIIDNIVKLCTFKNRTPQGAPSSPILSNIIFLDTDKKLYNLATKNSATYSRYADDITFSSTDIGIYDMIRYIENIIYDAGFKPNAKKTRYSTQKRRQIVTGIVVNSKPQPSRQYRYNFKAQLHNIVKNNVQLSYRQKKSLVGKYNWIKRFNPSFAESQLKKNIDIILNRERENK